MKLLKYITIGFFLCSSVVYADPIVTQSTSNSTVSTTGNTKTTVNSPPPSAISTSINSSNSDLCTVGVSGAVQTQILGLSGGKTVRDMNCERLKLSKTIYDMGMKVAAVSIMCHDARGFDAMKMAGTPCPYLGKIGQEASTEWDANPELQPKHENKGDSVGETIVKGTAVGLSLAGLLLLIF